MSEERVLSAKDAHTLLMADAQQRAETCRDEVSKICERHSVELVARAVIQGGNVQTDVVFVAK